MIKKLCVIPNDPIRAYHDKGEIKPRYYNPCNYFDEVHIISLSDTDIAPEKVHLLAGDAKLFIHPIGRPTPYNFPWFFPKVRKMIDRIAPDVIRAYNPRQSGSLAVYTGKKLGIPTAISLHLEYDDQRKYDKRLLLRAIKPLEYYSLKYADVTICVTEYLRQYARKYGANRCVTIYNKVYTEQFTPPSERPLNKTLTILSVGRLDTQKYQECLLQAIQSLDVKLVIIGQGELEAHLKNVSKQLNILHKVKFISSVPNTEIQQYYWAADIFALATHYEGFCIPILEAMAAGLPVVASQTPPLPEILGDAGIIVENSPEAFERVFQELIKNSEQRKRLGQKAKERAGSVNGKSMEQKEMHVYEQLVTSLSSERILPEKYAERVE